MFSHRSFLCSFSVVLALTAAASAQTTWHVDGAGTAPGSGTLADPYTSIQYALAQPATIAGDTVLVHDGVYPEQIDFLGKNVAVRSVSGSTRTVIDANSTGSVVTFKNGEGPGAVLDGFVIREGNGTATGGGWVDGGGIYVESASPTLMNLDVQHNLARRGAGVYLNNSNSALSGCTIQQNTGLCYTCYPMYGGGVWASGSPTFTNCLIQLNADISEGGGTYGSGTYVDCQINGNRGWHGGGVRGIGATFIHCTIGGNVGASVDADPGYGAGVWGGTLDQCLIVNNIGAYRGGGAYQATISNTMITGNSIGKPTSGYSGLIVEGGGASDCTLTNCEVYDNRAGSAIFGPPIRPGNGGGVAGGSATGCIIHFNKSHAIGPVGGPISETGLGGGGAYNATLVDCDVFANSVSTGGFAASTPGGGGLRGGSATRCRIWSNSAPYGAGAADCALTHCALNANSAMVAGHGVAALVSSSNAVVVKNSILWHDAGSETAINGGTLTISYSDVEGGFAGTGNINADPLWFGPFGHDYHLKAGSPCIDTGDPASPLDPDTTIADMGPYPFDANYCGAPSIYCIAKTNSHGCIPAIAYSGSNSFSGPDNFQVSASNVLSSNNGYMLWSHTGQLVPFAGGTLCLGSIIRTPVQNSGGTPPPVDCGGTYSFAFTHAYLASKGVVPGDTIYAQYMTRDPLHPDGTGMGLTDAVEVTFCP